MKRKLYNRGLSLVEILVGIAVVLLVVVMFSGALQVAAKLSRQNLRVVQANYLLVGEAETIRLARDNSWQANIVGYPASSSWSGNFLISSTAGPVYRNANDDIVPSGVLDLGTKKFVVVAAWSDNGATTTRSFPFYLTDIFAN